MYITFLAVERRHIATQVDSYSLQTFQPLVAATLYNLAATPTPALQHTKKGLPRPLAPSLFITFF